MEFGASTFGASTSGAHKSDSALGRECSLLLCSPLCICLLAQGQVEGLHKDYVNCTLILNMICDSSEVVRKDVMFLAGVPVVDDRGGGCDDRNEKRGDNSCAGV